MSVYRIMQLFYVLFACYVISYIIMYTLKKNVKTVITNTICYMCIIVDIYMLYSR